MAVTRRYVVTADPPDDGRLYIVRVEPETWNAPALIVLSDGEELISRWVKQTSLAEQICQEVAPVVVRKWAAQDGVELVELYRGSVPTPPVPAPPTDVF